MRYRMIQMMRSRGMTRQLARKILHGDRTLQLIYELSAKDLTNMYSIANERAIKLYADLRCKRMQEEIYRDEERYKILTWFDQNYPPLLRQIKDSPLILYAQGDETILREQPAISVIGTRKSSERSYRKTAAIVDPLSTAGFSIVSGLARGIDAQAHERTLATEGRTIAILGSGFDKIYPRENIRLAKMITHTGLLLSEYPPATPAQKYHFPERNRIISGLSFGVVVIEALSSSGTMITVDQALDQGREVYAVPDSIFLSQSGGCHDLIGQGAKLVTSGVDIAMDWLNFGSKQYEHYI